MNIYIIFLGVIDEWKSFGIFLLNVICQIYLWHRLATCLRNCLQVRSLGRPLRIIITCSPILQIFEASNVNKSGKYQETPSIPSFRKGSPNFYPWLPKKKLLASKREPIILGCYHYVGALTHLQIWIFMIRFNQNFYFPCYGYLKI